MFLKFSRIFTRARPIDRDCQPRRKWSCSHLQHFIRTCPIWYTTRTGRLSRQLVSWKLVYRHPIALEWIIIHSRRLLTHSNRKYVRYPNVSCGSSTSSFLLIQNLVGCHNTAQKMRTVVVKIVRKRLKGLVGYENRSRVFQHFCKHDVDMTRSHDLTTTYQAHDTTKIPVREMNIYNCIQSVIVPFHAWPQLWSKQVIFLFVCITNMAGKGSSWLTDWLLLSKYTLNLYHMYYLHNVQDKSLGGFDIIRLQFAVA